MLVGSARHQFHEKQRALAERRAAAIERRQQALARRRRRMEEQITAMREQLSEETSLLEAFVASEALDQENAAGAQLRLEQQRGEER